MINGKQLLNAMNEKDFQIRSQKEDPTKFVISIKSNEGSRFFLTRGVIGANDDKSPKYGWLLGKQWRPLKQAASNVPATPEVDPTSV